jgi:hypothetical protein
VRSQPAGAAPQTTFVIGSDIAADGSALLAGLIQVDATTRSLAVARVTYDGFPDADFGDQGAKGAFVGSFSQSPTTVDTEGTGVVWTPDGILVTGQTSDSLGRPQVLLLRLTIAAPLESRGTAEGSAA